MPRPNRWSGPPVEVSLVGMEAIDSRLTLIMGTMQDLRPAWNQFYAPAFYAAEGGFFATEGEGSWKAQNAAYAKWKAAHGFGGELMVKTGALKKSLTRKGAKWSTFKPRERFMEIGTTDPVANLHITKKARNRRIVVAGPESDILKGTIAGAAQQHVKQWEKEWVK